MDLLMSKIRHTDYAYFPNLVIYNLGYKLGFIVTTLYHCLYNS